MFELVSVLGAMLAPSVAPITVDGVLCHPGKLMVKATGPAAEAAIARTGCKIERRIPQIGWLVVSTPTGRLVESRTRLRKAAGVERAELDHVRKPAYDPNDPMWPDQWHMRTVKANTAWDISRGSPVVVAVIDTGVETSHPDLAANIWVNQGETPGNGIDDDANGYIDDVNGYDFAYWDAIPDDVHGHGTACSGIVAAVQDNNVGVTGVAPYGVIMCIKAAQDNGMFYDSAVVPAYVYAADMGARVFSMSFFTDKVVAAERDAIDYAWAKGVLPVVAAGNANEVYPYYPAAYEPSLAVAACYSDLSKAWFSDYGAWVDVAAPGVDLVTTAVGHSYTWGFGGTSGACPHVAGAATLLFGAKPSATNAEVRAALEDTARLIDQWPYGEYSNYGAIDVEAAVNALLFGPAPARQPIVRYIAPAQLGISLGSDNPTEMRVYGRGFQEPNTVEVRIGGVPQPIVEQRRDYIDVKPIKGRGTIDVVVNGNTIFTKTAPRDPRTLWAPADAGSQTGYVIGGNYVGMVDKDGVETRVTSWGDGRITVQAAFHHVFPRGKYRISIDRRYTGGPGGTESLYLYNWKSWSYPYGSWDMLQQVPVLGSNQYSEFAVPDITNYLDDMGSAYFYLETTGLSSSAELYVDVLNLVRIK